MGDRCNVLVVDSFNDNEVWLYSHWGGSEIETTVRDAMRRGRDRWGDGSYLARIIFSEMIKDDVMGTTGYGISAECGDGDNNVIQVNCKYQTVTYNGVTRTFDAFVEEKTDAG